MVTFLFSFASLIDLDFFDILMSAPASSDLFYAEDEDPLPEPEYDHLDLSFHDMASEGDGNVEGSFWDAPQKSAPCYSQYILGTLVVRVVAARDLEVRSRESSTPLSVLNFVYLIPNVCSLSWRIGRQPVQKGGLGQIFFGGSKPNNRDPRSNRSRNNGGSGSCANPYASVRYCGQAQRTTEVFDTTDPIWPRGETMFFDVSLPVSSNMTQAETAENSTGADADAEDRQASSASSVPPPPKPILTVALFHSTGSGVSLQKYPSKGAKNSDGDSDDPFLGMAMVDVTHVLTGKSPSFDEWIPLLGTENSRGKLRIVCEYEATDPPPRTGDKLRFTGYCSPAALYPVPPGLTYVVEEVDGDELVLSYYSPEGWLCTFSSHRFCFVCEERHQGAIETYQQELANLAERLAFSPLVNTVTETVERVPDDGLLFLGADAAKQGASLLNRWLKGGVGTAVGDIVYATNLDGRFNPDLLHGSLLVGSIEDQENLTEDHNNLDGLDTIDEVSPDSEPLPGMPCCPITGQPMRDPVVAADGHTYERSAIKRWLQTSNTSPLTGSELQHKNLVTNYVLVSSLQGAAVASIQEAK